MHIFQLLHPRSSCYGARSPPGCWCSRGGVVFALFPVEKVRFPRKNRGKMMENADFTTKNDGFLWDFWDWSPQWIVFS